MPSDHRLRNPIGGLRDLVGINYDFGIFIHYSTEVEQSSVFVSYRPSMYIS